MYKIFYILLLNKDTTRKKQAAKNIIRLDLKANNNNNYKLKVI